MGVITDMLPDEEPVPDGGRDARSAPIDDPAHRGVFVTFSTENDPFLNGFDTEKFDADDEVVSTVLTVVNILSNFA